MLYVLYKPKHSHISRQANFFRPSENVKKAFVILKKYIFIYGADILHSYSLGSSQLKIKYMDTKLLLLVTKTFLGCKNVFFIFT